MLRDMQVLSVSHNTLTVMGPWQNLTVHPYKIP